MLLSWTDILIMGKYETEENIGIYNAAFKIGTLTLFFFYKCIRSSNPLRYFQILCKKIIIIKKLLIEQPELQ